MRKRSPRKWLSRALAFLILMLFFPLAAPQLLAFPHVATIDGHRVYSEEPISPQLPGLVRRADRLVAESPLAASASKDQPIFLTSGGWRWKWLSGLSSGAFAISRPFVEVIVVNRTDQARNVVLNGAAVAGERVLDGVLAHEMAHQTIRSHFGSTADWRYPTELREGYCDFVARSGSLDDDQAQALIAAGVHSPALAYWSGRRRVAAELARNGGSVESLFANWDRQ